MWAHRSFASCVTCRFCGCISGNMPCIKSTIMCFVVYCLWSNFRLFLLTDQMVINKCQVHVELRFFFFKETGPISRIKTHMLAIKTRYVIILTYVIFSGGFSYQVMPHFAVLKNTYECAALHIINKFNEKKH